MALHRFVLLKVLSCMTLPLWLGCQDAGAAARHTTASDAGSQSTHEVYIEVDEVTTIARGTGAVATVQIGNQSVVAKEGYRSTIRLGKVTRQAIGPKARACLQIPGDADANPCHE